MVKAISLVAQRVEDTEILVDDSRESYLSIMTRDGKLLPLHDRGGGAFRLARLLPGFSASRNGIFLSDELENGIHHAAQRKIWDTTRQWMEKWNVQFAAAAHSGGFIDAAADVFADAPADLSLHKPYFEQQCKSNGRSDIHRRRT